MDDTEAKIVFWHRELPPLGADLVAEHTVEANSIRVPGTLAHRDELWDQCYRDLMAKAEDRLGQEVRRLGGHFAHVHHEAIEPKHDDVAGEAGLVVEQHSSIASARFRARAMRTAAAASHAAPWMPPVLHSLSSG